MAHAALLLLVEDEDVIRLIFREILVDEGYAVLTAANGMQAVRLLQEHHHAVQGLITDVNLGPGLTGWEVASHARAILPGVPVVYLSGNAGHEWTAQGVPGAVFLTKPFEPAQMVATLAALLNQPDCTSRRLRSGAG